MATSFNSGFALGNQMFNQAERNRLLADQFELEKAREARAAEEFGWRRDDVARQRAKDAEADSLTQQLTRPNADNYAFAPRGAGTGGLGLRMGNQPAAEMPAEGLVMPQLATGAAVEPGLRMPAQGEPVAPGGLRAPAMPDRPLTFNQAPTGAAAEDILGRLALIRGDTAGFRASQVAARGFKFEDGLKAQYAAFDAMSDEDRAKVVDRISLDQSIPGNGTWVAGTGKQQGYLNWTPPGKDPVKFSLKEARDLFALSNLMDIDPIRARAEMDKVSAQVRALAKDMFDTQAKGVTANNQATRFANADDLGRQELRAKQGYYGALSARANRPQAGDMREFVNDKGEVTLVDITGLPRRADGTIPLPPGLRPRAAKPDFTPKAYAETVKLYTEAGFPMEDARMMADRDFGRGPSTSADDRLRAKDDGVSKARRPIEVRPGETVMRDPSVPVRAPLDSFLREAVRQPMWRGGGLQYMYRDPLTNRTYTIDEYNKLLSE